tara:strand:- start:326 stop:907 length:582 start_codon:yes stop_codon:yes gene_type:complete
LLSQNSKNTKKEPTLAAILAGIHTLEQHLSHLNLNPEAYRPERCPSCGRAGLWIHGYYPRMSDRVNPSSLSLNHVPIPRFMCPHCDKTCSVLPECIAPRRWFPWPLQQIALALMISGCSLRQACAQMLPSRKTLWRWRKHLQDRFLAHADGLRSRFSALGRHAGLLEFWQACLAQMSLGEAMRWLHQEGLSMP